MPVAQVGPGGGAAHAAIGLADGPAAGAHEVRVEHGDFARGPAAGADEGDGNARTRRAARISPEHDERGVDGHRERAPGRHDERVLAVGGDVGERASHRALRPLPGGGRGRDLDRDERALGEDLERRGSFVGDADVEPALAEGRGDRDLRRLGGRRRRLARPRPRGRSGGEGDRDERDGGGRDAHDQLPRRVSRSSRSGTKVTMRVRVTATSFSSRSLQNSAPS